MPLITLLNHLQTLEVEFARLAEDSKPNSERRPAASAQDIAALAGKYRPELPNSYIEFLEINDGWRNYAFVGTILGTPDHHAEWLQISLDNMEMHFSENDQIFPISHQAIPIVANDFNDEKLIYAPSAETPFVEYRYADVIGSFPTLFAYLEEVARRMQSSIDYQTSGM